MWWRLSLWDRIACAALGAIFGAVYGAALTVFVAWRTGEALDVTYIVATPATFAVLGFVAGPYVGDILGLVLTVVFWAAAREVGVLPPRQSGAVANLSWLIVGTVVVFWLVPCACLLSLSL